MPVCLSCSKEAESVLIDPNDETAQKILDTIKVQQGVREGEQCEKCGYIGGDPR